MVGEDSRFSKERPVTTLPPVATSVKGKYICINATLID